LKTFDYQSIGSISKIMTIKKHRKVQRRP